jgi:magnesium transporter
VGATSMRYLVATQGPLTDPNPADIGQCLVDGKQGFWLDIENPDADDFALLEKTFKFHPLTIDDIRHQNQRPKVEDYPGYAFVVLFTAELEGHRVNLREHHLFLNPQYLVTVHLEPSDPLNRLRERIKANPDLTHRKTAYLFYLVVDQLVDALFPVLDQLDDATDEVEESIIKRPDTATLSELSDLKRTIVELRKVLAAQRDVFQRLTTSALGQTTEALASDFPREMTLYYRDVYDHLVRQYETVDSLRDLLSTAMDVYLSTVSNRLNLRITRLTVFATLFLPLTFLTGFFGMNFGWLVGHIAATWTFWVLAVGVMAVVTGGQLLYYRRFGWI